MRTIVLLMVMVLTRPDQRAERLCPKVLHWSRAQFLESQAFNEDLNDVTLASEYDEGRFN